MSAHLKALFGVLLAGAIFAGIYFASVHKAESEVPAPSMDLVEQMRASGIPEIKAPDLSGKAFEGSIFKGKILIVNFWASWCEPCIEEVPSLMSLVRQLDGQAELIAISGDSDKAEIMSFLKSFPGLQGPHITLLWDQDKSLVKKFGIERLPETFIAGRDGKLVKKVVGSVRWDHAESVSYFKELIQTP